jgi:hypothetical protein
MEIYSNNYFIIDILEQTSLIYALIEKGKTNELRLFLQEIIENKANY